MGTLGPRNWARLVQFLVERVDYNGSAGAVTVTFRANGIKQIARPEQREMAA